MPAHKKNKMEDSINGEMANRSFPVNNETLAIEEKTKVRSIRFHESRLKALEKHFKREGIDLSSGVRQVIYRWMDEKRIRP